MTPPRWMWYTLLAVIVLLIGYIHYRAYVRAKEGFQSVNADDTLTSYRARYIRVLPGVAEAAVTAIRVFDASGVNLTEATPLRARYVRLYPAASSYISDNFLQISQIRVVNRDGVNIAQGKTVTANHGGYDGTATSPSVIVDGATDTKGWGSTFWCSATTSNDNYVEVDLGSSEDIYRIEYIGRSDLDGWIHRNYGVRIMLMNGSGTTREEVTTYITGSRNPKHTIQVAQSLANAVPTRYVRVYGSNILNQNNLMLSQIQVIDTTGKNVALNKLVTASSNAGSWAGSAPVSTLTSGAIGPSTWTGDATTNKVWHSLNAGSTTTGNIFVEIDLGAVFNVSRIVIFGRTDWADGWVRYNEMPIELIGTDRQVQAVYYTSSNNTIQTVSVTPYALSTDADTEQYENQNAIVGGSESFNAGNNQRMNTNIVRWGRGMHVLDQKTAPLPMTGTGQGFNGWRADSATAYIEIDMKEEKDIYRVEYWGRSDCTTGCNSGVRIQLLDRNKNLLRETTTQSQAIQQTVYFKLPDAVLNRYKGPGGVRGRYVRIQANPAGDGSSWLAISQIAVYDNTGKNVAKGALARSDYNYSETWPTWRVTRSDPSVITDGILQPRRFRDGKVWHISQRTSDKTQNYFIQIDLGSTFDINSIVYFGRVNEADADFSARNKGIRFTILDEARAAIIQKSTTGTEVIQAINFPGANLSLGARVSKVTTQGGGTAIEAPGITARFIRIKPPSTDEVSDRNLAISQIIVLDVDGNNIAKGASTKASSTLARTSSSAIVDGTLLPKIGPNIWVVGKTDTKNTEYLEIDLGSMKKISKVIYIGGYQMNSENDRANILIQGIEPTTTNTCVGECSTRLINTNRKCVFDTQKDGNLVVYSADGNGVLWSRPGSWTNSPPYNLVMQQTGDKGGKLLLYRTASSSAAQTNERVLDWEIGTAGTNAPYTLTLRDDCNLVIQDRVGTVTWQTGVTSNPSGAYSLFTDTIIEGSANRNRGVQIEFRDAANNNTLANYTLQDNSLIQVVDTDNSLIKITDRIGNVSPKNTFMTARYVRIRPPSSADKLLGISQIVVLDTNGNNIALNRPVTVTTTATGTGEAYRITDGVYFPRDKYASWVVGSTTGDQYVTIDLGDMRKISRIFYIGRSDLLEYNTQNESDSIDAALIRAVNSSSPILYPTEFCIFDAVEYLKREADVRDAEWARNNPSGHYKDHGIYEGRPACGNRYPKCRWNSQQYLNRYADVRNTDWARNDPLGHYRGNGINEGRSPCPQVPAVDNTGRNMGVRIQLLDSANRLLGVNVLETKDTVQVVNYMMAPQIDASCKNSAIKGRYVRVKPSLTDADASYLCLSQIMVFDENGVNVAFGKAVAASSFSGTADERSRPAGIVVDGTTATRSFTEGGLWQVSTPSTATNDGEFWQVDLGEPKNITSIVYIGRGGDTPKKNRNRGVRIQILDNDRSQLKQYQLPNTNIIQTIAVCETLETNEALICNPTSGGVPARFVRVYGSLTRGVDYADTNNNILLSQLQVFNTSGVNIASGILPTTNAGTFSGSRPLSFITDGATAARSYADGTWISKDGGDDKYLELDLGTIQSIKRIVLMGRSDDAANDQWNGSRNMGMPVQLLDIDGNVIVQYNTLTKDITRTIDICSSTENYDYRPMPTICTPPSAWYVRIMPRTDVIPTSEDTYLTLTQIRVIDTKGVNVAYKKPVTASSDWGGGNKNNIVNGSQEPRNWAGNTSWWTNSNRYWQYAEINLGQMTPIRNIIYIGRAERNANFIERNKNVRIQLLDAFHNIIREYKTTTTDSYQRLDLCSLSGAIPVVEEAKAAVCFPGVIARKVRIKPYLPAAGENALTSYLNISQIQIYGRDGTNIAVGKPCTASSTLPESDLVQTIVDGATTTPRDYLASNIYSGVFHNGTTSSTSSDNQFVDIDLEAMTPITRVVYMGMRNIDTVANDGVNRRPRNKIRIQFLDDAGNILSERSSTSTENMQVFEICGTRPAVPPPPPRPVPVPLSLRPRPLCNGVTKAPLVKSITIEGGGSTVSGSTKTLAISQIALMNEKGQPVMTGATATGYKGATLQTTSSAGYLVDGNMGPRRFGTGFVWRGDKRDDYVTITFPTEVEVSQIVYVGELVEETDTARIANNEGVTVKLRNTAGTVLFEGRTSTTAVKQAIYVCIPQTVVTMPASIECSTRSYANGKKQFLCKNKGEAMKLFRGPDDKTKRYLADGDQVCVAKEEGSMTYSCYEPYSKDTDPSYYEDDTTGTDALDNYDVLCDTVTKNFYDLSGGMLSLTKTRGDIGTVESRLTKSMGELDALYASMGCAAITSSTSIQQKNMCDAIQKGKTEIAAQVAKIKGVKDGIASPIDQAVTARANINRFMKQFNCNA